MIKYIRSGFCLLGFLFLAACGEVAVDGVDVDSTSIANSSNATLSSLTVTPGTSIVDINGFVQLTATGGFSDDTSQDVSASVNWVVDDATIATVSAGGLLQGLSTGTVTVTASDGGYSDVAIVTVSSSAVSPENISVTSPTSNNTMQPGASMQLSALGDFGTNGTANINSAVEWSVSNSDVATISDDGVLTALSAGVVTVTATIGSMSESITIVISSEVVTLDSIEVTPAISVVDEGASVQLMAVGSYSDNSTANVNGSVTWSVSDAAIATVNASGLLTTLTPGLVTVTASNGTVSDSATVTVNAVVTNPPAISVVGVVLTPETSSVLAGETVQLNATAILSDNSMTNVNNVVNWSVDDSSIAAVSPTGLVSTLAAGVVNVRVDYGIFNDSVTVAVNAAPVALESINVSAASNSADVGETVQLSAIGSYSDNSTANLSNSVTWSVSDPVIASVSSNGLLTLLSAGVVTVTATDGNISNATSVTVNAVEVTLQSIAVSPENAVIEVGSTQQFTAIGTYSDGSTEDLTGLAGWSINVGIASVASGGLLTATGEGTVTVRAQSAGVSGSVDLTINSASVTLESIEVTPASSSVDIGATVQLSAVGSYSDNSSTNISGSVSWTVSDSTIASVSASGLLTALAAGDVTVTATDGAVSDSAAVTVTTVPVTLDSINVTPATSSLDVGEMVQLVATGSYSDNTTQDLSNTVSWSISDPSIASISVNGLLSAAGEGAVTVTATSGAISSDAVVNVNPAPVILQSIAVTPANSAIEVGETVQLVATGTYSDNTTAVISNAVSWTVNAGIATVSATGLLSANADGIVTVTATSGAVSSNATVSIDPVPVTLQSIAVTPATSTIEVGDTVQFLATGTYSDNSTADISSSVTWTVDSSIASINLTGLLSTTADGSVTVTAASGTISGTAAVTINPVPVTLQSIAVTPANSTVEVGETVQLLATGTYSDNSTADLTNSVSWTVNAGVASVNSAGVLSTTSEGTVTVTATSGAISATAVVTIDPIPVTLQSIAVTPANSTIEVGEMVQLFAIGTYSDNSTADISSSVTWTVDSSVASVNLTGLVSASADGTVTVTATSGATSGTAAVTIDPIPVTLQSIAVTPLTSAVEVGSTVQYVATGTYSDNSTADLSATATWSVSDSSIASISASGLLNAIADGTVQITATSGAIAGNASITVNPAPINLLAVSVTPSTSTVEIGESVQFLATGHYSDSSTADITSSVGWSVNAGIASIDSNGLLISSSDGVVTVTANSNGIIGSANVTINPAAVTLQSIAVTPASVFITAGAAQQMIATATYSDASTADISDQVVWTSADSAVASISAAGVLNGDSVGTTDVSASLGGINSNSVPVDISAAVPATLKLSEINRGTSSVGFWFELYNPSTVAVDLGQYSIKSGNLTTPEALPTKLVPPGAYLVIMTRDLFDNLAHTISYEGSPNVVILPEQTFTWSSSGYIELLEDNETVDFVRFGTNNVAPTTASAWNGAAAPGLSNNIDYHHSIARDTSHTDTDSASDWTLKEYASIGGPNDITCATDDDGDGIPDCSEVPGSTFAGMDLYAMGARVNQKDLFVEIDYMDPAGTTDTNVEGMLPQREVLDRIKAEFLAHDFHVHFDVGDYLDQSPGIDPLDYDLGGGGFVPFAEKIMFRFFGQPDGSHLDPEIADIYVYKAKYMELKRRQFFYYIVFAYTHAQGASGVSEVNGNDSFIALGSWNLNRDDQLKTNQLINYQSGTLIHEFGHALGLSHGGFEGTNYKPNYLSSMNYMYATNGIPVQGNNEGDRYYLFYNSAATGNFQCKINLTTSTLNNGPFDDWTTFGLGFSDGSSIDLDEVNGISEALGFGRPNGGSIDFNCDGEIDDTLLTNFSVNRDQDVELLKDYDDWSNIRFFFSQDLRHVQNGVSREDASSTPRVFVGKDWARQPKIYAEPAIPNRKAIQERDYKRARQRADRKAFEDSITHLH